MADLQPGHKMAFKKELQVGYVYSEWLEASLHTTALLLLDCIPSVVRGC